MTLQFQIHCYPTTVDIIPYHWSNESIVHFQQDLSEQKHRIVYRSYLINLFHSHRSVSHQLEKRLETINKLIENRFPHPPESIEETLSPITILDENVKKTMLAFFQDVLYYPSRLIDKLDFENKLMMIFLLNIKEAIGIPYLAQFAFLSSNQSAFHFFSFDNGKIPRNVDTPSDNRDPILGSNIPPEEIDKPKELDKKDCSSLLSSLFIINETVTQQVEAPLSHLHFRNKQQIEESKLMVNNLDKSFINLTQVFQTLNILKNVSSDGSIPQLNCRLQPNDIVQWIQRIKVLVTDVFSRPIRCTLIHPDSLNRLEQDQTIQGETVQRYLTLGNRFENGRQDNFLQDALQQDALQQDNVQQDNEKKKWHLVHWISFPINFIVSVVSGFLIIKCIRKKNTLNHSNRLEKGSSLENKENALCSEPSTSRFSHKNQSSCEIHLQLKTKRPLPENKDAQDPLLPLSNKQS